MYSTCMFRARIISNFIFVQHFSFKTIKDSLKLLTVANKMLAKIMIGNIYVSHACCIVIVCIKYIFIYMYIYMYIFWICLAFFVHGGTQIALLLWKPQQDPQYMFYILAGLWGIGDAVIQTQINGMTYLCFLYMY